MGLRKEYKTYKEFVAERKSTDQYLEYIDGTIYMAPSPSIKHQEISSFLHGELYNALKNTDCKLLAAPTDVVFDHDNENKKKIVIPDLFVACNLEGFTENEYMGPPDFIIEILSPANKAYDMITKLNLYMNSGVKEYWIVDPMEERILAYFVDENHDIQFKLFDSKDIVKSKVFEVFEINVQELFSIK